MNFIYSEKKYEKNHEVCKSLYSSNINNKTRSLLFSIAKTKEHNINIFTYLDIYNILFPCEITFNPYMELFTLNTIKHNTYSISNSNSNNDINTNTISFSFQIQKNIINKTWTSFIEYFNKINESNIFIVKRTFIYSLKTKIYSVLSTINEMECNMLSFNIINELTSNTIALKSYANSKYTIDLINNHIQSQISITMTHISNIVNYINDLSTMQFNMSCAHYYYNIQSDTITIDKVSNGVQFNICLDMFNYNLSILNSKSNTGYIIRKDVNSHIKISDYNNNEIYDITNNKIIYERRYVVEVNDNKTLYVGGIKYIKHDVYVYEGKGCLIKDNGNMYYDGVFVDGCAEDFEINEISDEGIGKASQKYKNNL